MAQSGCGGGGCPRDVQLPDEILSVMPTDPYDQLDLAKRITAMAISSRVSQLEAEAEKLHQKIAHRDRVIAELQNKFARLDRSYQDSEARLKATLEENSKIAKERDTLMITSKKMARDLTKLETFKRHLMQSLNDANLYQRYEVDIGSNRQPFAKISSWRDDESSIQSGMELANGSSESEDLAEHGLTQATSQFSITPYITPHLTPGSTPKVYSTGDSPLRLSTAGSSPGSLSGSTSPTKSQFEGHHSFSSLYPSSQQSSVTSSPPNRRSFPGHTPRIDGKELFRQARNRLSYEQFAAFLANVKELNAQRQSREETLAKAEEIFGIENKDLYLSFQGLLNRNIP